MQTTTDTLDDAKLEKILSGVRIPPQPNLLLELQEEQKKPAPNINKLCSIITKDVALSASVLKTVNSPFYGLPRKIDSVQRAVMLLGLKNVLNLVRAFCLRNVMADKTVSLERFWETATDVANICMAVGNRFLIKNADELYSLGLFHDCGIAVLAQKFPDYKQILKTGNGLIGKPITDAEDDAYQTNHAVVGYYMAKSWNLSPNICDVVQRHHDVEKMFSNDDADNEKNQLMAVLKMAGNISHSFRRLAEDHEWDAIQVQVLTKLAITNEEYVDLKEDIFEMLHANA